MSSPKRLFGTNGIRGVVNEELTAETVMRIATAAGKFFERGSVLVGHDARTSGPMLTRAIVAGLTATGCNAFLAGMVPTPALQYAVKCHGLDGGIIVTASHNPPEYNGIKVLWKDGIEISRDQEVKIEETYFNAEPCLVAWDSIGEIRDLPGVIDVYVEAVKAHVDTAAIAQKNYHVVVDAANSVGSLAAPRLLRELGCKVTTLNANIDGTFPGRLPEPRPENLSDLSRVVKVLGANLGVAYDGDADRSVFVDETGEIHMGDKTFALVEKYFLKSHPGEQVVTPVSSSRLVQEIAESGGGKIVWTKVGSVTVSHTMKKLGAELGGEENGGIFYGPHQPVRDGAMSTALILDIMAKTGQKLSQLLVDLPEYFIEKGKIECREELKEKVLATLLEEVKGLNVNAIDGAKIWFEDGSGILLRPSGTEQVFRLYAEAKTRERAADLLEEYAKKLKEIIRNLPG